MLYKIRVRSVNEAGESRPDHTAVVAPRQKLVLPSVILDAKVQGGLSGIKFYSLIVIIIVIYIIIITVLYFITMYFT